MSFGDTMFGIHATALSLRQQRMAMLASNIANAATPNYKARDLDFAAALASAEQGQSPEGALRFRVPTQPSLSPVESSAAVEFAASPVRPKGTRVHGAAATRPCGARASLALGQR